MIKIIIYNINFTSYIEVQADIEKTNFVDKQIVYTNKSISESKKFYWGIAHIDSLNVQNIIFNAPTYLSGNKKTEYYITEIIKYKDSTFYIIYLDKSVDLYDTTILIPVKKKLNLNRLIN
jgi:hypothetical protein